MMQKIIVEAEQSGLVSPSRRRDEALHYSSIAGSLSWAAVELAEMTGAKGIAAFSNSGATARLMAKALPRVPVIGLSPDPMVVRQMNLGRGVRPLLVAQVEGIDAMCAEVDRVLLAQGLAEVGDSVVITAGHPGGPPWRTNLVKVQRIGEPEE
jgi:pyruvate kinase